MDIHLLSSLVWTVRLKIWTFSPPDKYHWLELPQVSFLSWQKFCHDKHVYCDKHMFVATKHIFCHDKSMLVMTSYNTLTFVTINTCLSWQDRSFVVTKVCLSLSQQILVVTNIILSRQMFCRDNHNFVTTKLVFLQQAYFRRYKRCVLSRQTFVATKMIFVAAPTNDRQGQNAWQTHLLVSKQTWGLTSTKTTRLIRDRTICLWPHIYVYIIRIYTKKAVRIQRRAESWLTICLWPHWHMYA